MAHSKALTFEKLLEELAKTANGDDDGVISVRELLAAVGHRSYGPVLLLLGFIAISPLTLVPGANWLVALVTLLFAGQIVFGLKHPWVPRKALEATFPRKYLDQAVEVGRPWAQRIDRFTRPRLSFLTDAPFVQIIALACVGAALLTFPLGLIPLGPVLPSLAVLFFGLGLSSRDGLFLILSGGALAGAIYVLFQVGERLTSVVAGML